MTDPQSDYEAWCKKLGLTAYDSTSVCRLRYYTVYVPIQHKDLFLSHGFKERTSLQYPPTVNYAVLAIGLSYETSKTALIKRIYKFHPYNDFFIPIQHQNSKKWNQ